MHVCIDLSWGIWYKWASRSSDIRHHKTSDHLLLSNIGLLQILVEPKCTSTTNGAQFTDWYEEATLCLIYF